MMARMMARIYRSLGILSKGQLVEVDRSGLVAGYVGQTALKTQKVIEKAMGGVLFIDEAYALNGKSENDFGQEAIDTILKAMEDHRDDLVVIVAGYTELMDKFIHSNPGPRAGGRASGPRLHRRGERRPQLRQCPRRPQPVRAHSGGAEQPFGQDADRHPRGPDDHHPRRCAPCPWQAGRLTRKKRKPVWAFFFCSLSAAFCRPMPCR